MKKPLATRSESATRLPLNLFAVPFGLAGLATSWDAARQVTHSPAEVGASLWLVALGVWLVIVGLFAWRAHFSTAGSIVSDLRNPITGPFAALAPLVGIMLAAHFGPLVAGAAIPAALVFLAVCAAIAAMLGAFWLRGGVGLGDVHPGYMLPTVAVGLVASVVFARLGLQELSVGLLGIGLFTWAIVNSLILARSLSGQPVAGALTPTLAILAAPPAVAGTAWLALGAAGGMMIGSLLMGLTAFGVVVQLFLLRDYAKLSFAPSFWSFTFSSSAVATFTIQWFAFAQMPAAVSVAWVAVLAVTVLIGGIGIRMLVSLFPRSGDPVPLLVPPMRVEEPDHA
jgi:tellurite resistance protein